MEQEKKGHFNSRAGIQVNVHPGCGIPVLGQFETFVPTRHLKWLPNSSPQVSFATCNWNTIHFKGTIPETEILALL